MAPKQNRKITDADLARVGPDTPAGQWLRRYWLAISRAEDLKTFLSESKFLARSWCCFAMIGGGSAY